MFKIDPSTVPSVSADDERVLIARAQLDDSDARNLLLLAHIPYVLKVVRTVTGRLYRNADMDDLIMEGILGDIIGIDRFDLSIKNIRYWSYGYWWAQALIKSFLHEEWNWISNKSSCSVDGLDTVDDQIDVLGGGVASLADISYIADNYTDHQIDPIENVKDRIDDILYGRGLFNYNIVEVMLSMVNGELSSEHRNVLKLQYSGDAPLTQRALSGMLGVSVAKVAKMRQEAFRVLRDRALQLL